MPPIIVRELGLDPSVYVIIRFRFSLCVRPLFSCLIGRSRFLAIFRHQYHQPRLNVSRRALARESYHMLLVVSWEVTVLALWNTASGRSFPQTQKSDRGMSPVWPFTGWSWHTLHVRDGISVSGPLIVAGVLLVGLCQRARWPRKDSLSERHSVRICRAIGRLLCIKEQTSSRFRGIDS